MAYQNRGEEVRDLDNKMTPRRWETSGISHQISASFQDPAVVKGGRQKICRRCSRHLFWDGVKGLLESSVDKRWNGADGLKLAFLILRS